MENCTLQHKSFAALQSGEYDLTVGLNSDLYEKVKDLPNLKVAVKDGCLTLTSV